jgi:uncharacterized membrane protein YcaP (DUF421 family)
MSTILHAIVGYFFLLLTVRVLTRRPGAQMTLFEFVIVFLIGGIIILSTVGEDRSMTNCITAILTAAAMHRLVSWAKMRWPRLGAIVDGTPLVLINNGQYVHSIMDRMRVKPEDIMAAARGTGTDSIFKVKYAILERNGTISIIPTDDGS